MNTTLHVKGMHCGACVEKVREIINRTQAITSEISLSDELVVLKSPSLEITDSVIKNLTHAGYPASKEVQKKGITLETRLIIAIIGTLPLLLHMVIAVPLFHNPWFQLACSIPVFAVGLPFFIPGAIGSIKTRAPNMDLLVVMAVLSGIAASVWGLATNDFSKIFLEPAASILTIVLLGSVIERRAFQKADEALEGLGNSTQSTVKVLREENGKVEAKEILASELSIGDKVIVELGNTIPQDGVVESGSAEVNESIVTGESFPVLRGVGDVVIGGSTIQTGSIVFKVTATSETSFYARLTSLVREARNSRPRFQKLLDRVVAWFVPIVLLVAIGVVVAGPSLFNLTFSEALSRALAVLVIACPCAIGLATPVALSVGLGTAARKGILFRDIDAIMGLSTIKNILFDKTGTITDASLQVEKIEYFKPIQNLSSKILSLESHSTHPAAKALCTYFKSEMREEVISSTETPGLGIEGLFQDGTTLAIGSKKILKSDQQSPLFSVYVASEGELVAGIILSELIRPDAQESILALKRLGVTPIMATGDSLGRAQEVAHTVGVSKIHASLTPDKKLSLLRTLQDSGVTGFVGDGINDAPVLSGAAVGIAVSDASIIAKTSAHVLLLKPGLGGVIDALKLSKKMRLIINQNIFWAFIYNLIAIPLAASGIVSPLIGALTMVLSDVCVVGNALRLRSIK